MSCIVLMLICLDYLCFYFCNKRNFKYFNSIIELVVGIILSRSRPVGNVQEIAKVELEGFTARSQNFGIHKLTVEKQSEIFSVPVEVLEKKPSGVEVKKQEKDPLPSRRKQKRKSSSFLLENQGKYPLVLKLKPVNKLQRKYPLMSKL